MSAIFISPRWFTASLVAATLYLSLFLAPNSGQAACIPAPPNLVGFWTGDAHAYDLVDGAAATLRNGTTYTNGQVAGAFQFDGTSQYIQVGALAKLKMTNQFTVEAWIFPANTTDAVIVNKEGEYGLARFADATIRWAVANTSPGWVYVNSGYVAPAGAWTHLAWTFNQGTNLLYANGSLVQTYNGSGNVGDANTSQNEFWIGGRQSTAQYYKGAIDEVSVHNRALSASEVAGIFAASYSGKCRPSCPERSLRAASLSEVAGRQLYLPVSMLGLGDENALSFSLSFDPSRLMYLGEVAGAGAVATSLIVNTNQLSSGRIGYALAKPAGQFFTSGSNELVRVRFALGSQAGALSVDFADAPLARETVNGTANPMCSGYSNAVVTILTLTSPSIVTAPQSQTIQPVQGVPTNVTFTVSATGSAPLAYQWRFNSANIAGATATSLTLTNVTSANAGQYDVVVTNDGGTLVSPAASLGLLPALIPPYIVTQPRSQIVSTGETLYLSVVGNGSMPLRYQWTKAGANVSNATNSVYSITNLTTAAAGNYAVKLNNDAGAVTSVTATVTVSTSIRTVRIVDQNVATGSSIDVPVELVGLGDENAIGFSLNFDAVRLTFLSTALGTGATGAGLLLNTNDLALGRLGFALTKPAGQVFASGTSRMLLVRFQARDTSGIAALAFGDQPVRREIADVLGNVRSSIFLDGAVNVLATAPAIASQPQSASAPIFSSLVLRPDVSGSVPLYFQWQREGLNLAGATLSTLTLNNVLPSQAGAYRVVVTNAAGAVTSAVANVTVPRVVRLGATNGPTGNLVELPIELLCQGDENAIGFSLGFNPAEMALAGVVSGSQLGTSSLNWNTNQPGRVGIAVARLDNGAFLYGTQQVARLQFLLGQSAGTRNVTFADQPVLREMVDTGAQAVATEYQPSTVTAYIAAPTIIAQPLAQTVWGGTNVTFAVTAVGTRPMTYQWLRNGAAVSGATDSSCTINNVQTSHAGNYSVQVTSSAGSVISGTALLTVLVPRPDFFVSGVKSPAEAMGGQPLQVTWNLFNVGNAASDPGWHHTLWLARDTAGSGAEFVAALPFTDSLAAGQSLSITGAVIIPPASSGDRYFLVRADGSNVVSELNEANNSAVAAAKIHITSGDLVLREVSAPTIATLGTAISLTWVGANAGITPANVVWRDSIFLATNGNSLVGATRLATLPARGGAGTAPATLDPGASYTNSLSVTLPSNKSLSPGNYYLTVMIDASGDLPETEETNNLKTTSVTLQAAPLPDLAISAVLAPPTVQPGSGYTLIWAITNQGTAEAKGPWRDAVMVSNLVSGTREIALFDFTNSIALSSVMWRTQAVVWPNCGPASEVNLLVAADYQNSVEELRETNNLGTSATSTFIPNQLTLTLPFTQVPEDTANAIVPATLTRNGDISSQLAIAIAITDRTSLDGPTNIIMAAGQETLSFDLRVLHDLLVTGNKTITLTASAPGYVDGTRTLSILNTDLPKLTLTLDATAVLEGQSVTATVTRDVVTDAAATVLLQSSAPSQLSAPLSVRIPAGAPSWTFAILAVDDDVVEPNATYTVTVSAAGFEGGGANVVVVDNDLPTVTLTLAEHQVSESAGLQATFATVKRSLVTARALMVEIESSDPTAARAPARVTIPAYAESTSFPVAAVDDVLVDGPQTTVLTPFVLSATGVRMGAGATDSLTVSDDDGPTLFVSVDKKLLAEGLSPAAMVTVTRNTPATNSLSVSLRSSDVDEATVPPQLVIPIGTNSAQIALATIADNVNDGNKSVVITAEAAGFTAGSTTVVVSDTDLPDLTIESVTIPPSAETEGYFTVAYRVLNQGLSAAGTNFTTRVYLSSDPVAGSDALVGQFQFNGSLLPGGVTEQTLAVRAPLNAGQSWVIVQTDAGQEISEIREDNNIGVSRSAINIQPAYTATAQTEITSAVAGTPIPMYGVAVLSGGGPAIAKPVNIHIISRGTERVIAAITGMDGGFALTWTPLPGEAGVYDIFATHPGVSSAAVQDQFRLLGMRAEPGSVSLTVRELSSVTGTVRLVNGSDQPLQGVTATLLEQPPELGVSIDLSGSTLPGSGSLNLNYTFTANTASAYGWVRVRLSSSEGLTVDVPFAVSVAPLRPHLVATPGNLSAGMARGRQTAVEFTVQNDGGIVCGPLGISTPNVPWISVVTENPLPPIAPGETNAIKVTLLLQPAPDLPLGPYSGSIALHSSNATLSVPFTFRALSEARGDLLITAVDELTYYAEGAPNLAGAAVTVIDSVSRQTVASGFTDASGKFFAPSLPEAYYDVSLTAEKHTAYRNTHLLTAGQTNEISAFLSRQVVTYTWTVQPVAIEDNYRITVETTFETTVPLPVVTIEPAVIDLGKITAEVTQIDLKVSNQGLIAANSTRLSFPTHPLWRFEPLVENLGTLPAKSSLTVPLIIRKVPAGPGPQPKEDSGPCHTSAGVCWDLECGGRTNTYCGTIAMPNARTGCGGTAPVAGVPGTSSTGGGIVGGPGPASSGGGSTGSAVYVSMPSFSTPTVCDCDSFPTLCISGSGGFSVDGFATKLAGAVTRFLPNFSVKSVEVTVHADGNLCTCCKSNQLSWEGNASVGADVKIVLRAGPSFSGSLGFTAAGWSGIEAELDAMVGLEVTISGSVSGSLIRKCMEDPDACLSGSIGFSLFAGASLDASVKASYSDGYEYSGEVHGRIGLEGSATASISGCVRGGITMSVCGQIKAIANASGSLKAVVAGHEETKEVSVNCDTVIAQAGCDGGGLKGDGPIVDIATRDDILTPEASIAEALGISAVPPSGICAHVKLRTEQDAVISRDAFRATLELGNADTVRLEQLQAEVIVRDEAGTDATALFGIRPPELVGISSVDGTGILPAQSTGTAKWTIIPTSDAAPTASRQYFVSGKLRYSQGGALVSVPLAPVAITVLPNPKLVINYFHERDVFADDPFTAEVEPSIPFNLAVMIQNQGYGSASNMRITSAQPQIVDNEKGLLIDFRIIATEVAGRNMVPSLTADFGNIGPGQSVVGRWLMTSTLQGLFIDYSASFVHVDALNNPKLSLIDSVAIHEMIHLVRAGGTFEDGKPDFLVNDVQDLNDRPDTLWLSDGRTFPVTVVEQGSVDATPNASRLQVHLNATLPPGWVYLRIPEPSNGGLQLVRVERADGSSLGVGTNAWTTDRTFVGRERPPVRENILHLLDYNSTGIYTLTYQPAPVRDTTAPISSVVALPAQSSGQIAVSWTGQDNTDGSGIASYDVYVSINGGLFTPWLIATTQNGAVYPGVQNNSYAFYSIATDRAGNRESVPATPDAQTTVNIVNHAPQIASLSLQTLNEGSELSLTIPASDPDLPNDRLTFTLSDAPAGMWVDPSTGIIRWPTTEASGPSTNNVTITVGDSGSPPMSASAVLTVIVNEVNQAPRLPAIANRIVNEGALLQITNVASDADMPPNTLTYALGLNPPLGVTIDPARGILRWRPAENQGPSTNWLSMIVTDNGVPPLSATQQFAVVVRDMLSDFSLSLGTTNVYPGEANSVPLVLKSSRDLSALSFVFRGDPQSLANSSLRVDSPEVLSAGLVMLGPEHFAVNLTLDPAQSLSSTRQLASLDFSARNVAHSVIVPLLLSQPLGTTPGGGGITNASVSPGRVIVVAAEPVLTMENPLQRKLTLYGYQGVQYMLQSSTNLAFPDGWRDHTGMTLTNRFQVLQWTNILGPSGFLRAVVQ